MTIKVYNALSRKLEHFKPLKEKKVGIYVCGPTVYDYSHIGHARTYIAFDVIVRYLKYRGYDVKYVVNITDVEDKIINKAREMGVKPRDISKKFEEVFFEDMNRLGVLKADFYPRVSNHIVVIINMVQILVQKGFGYEVNGNIYFDISKFTDYGRLSRQSIDSIKAGARVEIDQKKRNPTDFALWKSAKENEIGWESPWGKGRPGWHIECSAMANKYLGYQFDIHGGGRDLIFPHHENEIAQSEAYSGRRPVVKYWLHSNLLTINGEKMSKSLNNFIAINDLLSRFEADVLRLFIISTHYRRPIDFSEENLKDARQRLIRIKRTIENLRERIEHLSKIDEIEDVGKEFWEQIQAADKEFINAMDDDFNTPLAITAFYRLIQIGNRALAANSSRSILVDILNTVIDKAQILGIIIEKKKIELSKEAKRLLRERETARNRKNWKKADELREKLRKMGILVEDLPNGTRWRYE